MEVYGVKQSYGNIVAFGRGEIRLNDFRRKNSNISLYLKEDGVVSSGDLISFNAKCLFKKTGTLNSAATFVSYENLKVIEQEHLSFYCFLGKSGEYIGKTAVNLTYGNITRLFPALLTGNKSYLLKEQEKIIKNSGISHLVAVSGMHLAVLLSVLNLFLRDCGSKTKFVLGNLICLFAAGISAFTPSVMRAWLIVFLVLLGDTFGRRADTLTSIGFFMMICCFICPQWLYNVGMWLSVGSVIGISLLTPVISQALIKLFKIKGEGFFYTIINMLSITLSANIGTLPIVSVTFGCIPFWSILSNLFIISLITPAMVLLWVAVALKIILNIEIPIITYGAVKLSEISLTIAEFFAELPPKTIGFSERYVKFFLISASLFLFVLVLNDVRGKKLIICVNFILISFFAAVTLNTYSSLFTVTVVASKENNCCAIIKNREALFIGSVKDSYGGYVMEGALKSCNVKKISAVIMDERDNADIHQRKFLEEFNCGVVLGENRTAKKFAYGSGIPYGVLTDGAIFSPKIGVVKNGDEITFNFKDGKILKKGNRCVIIEGECRGLSVTDELFFVKLHF